MTSEISSISTLPSQPRAQAAAKPTFLSLARPSELLNFTAVAALTILTAILFATRRLTLHDAVALWIRYLFLFTALVVVVRSNRKPIKNVVARFFADFYTLLVIIAVYDSLEPLIRALHWVNGTSIREFDSWFAAADRFLLAGHDAEFFMAPLHYSTLTVLLYFSYLTYFFMPPVACLAVWIKDQTAARRFLFVVTACFYLCYVFYLVLPALGPRFYLAPYNDVASSTRVGNAIAQTLLNMENTLHDVFPSGHVALAVVSLVGMLPLARKAFFWMLPFVALLMLATVYCRFHYLIDVIAGLALAAVAPPLLGPLYNWLLKWHYAPTAEAASNSGSNHSAGPAVPTQQS